MEFRFLITVYSQPGSFAQEGLSKKMYLACKPCIGETITLMPGIRGVIEKIIHDEFDPEKRENDRYDATLIISIAPADYLQLMNQGRGWVPQQKRAA